MACRDKHQVQLRAERRRQARLPAGPVTRTLIDVIQVPGRQTDQPRKFYAGYCGWCGDAFVTTRRARYCSDLHAHYPHKRGAHPRLAHQVYERDNWTCMICHELVDRDAHYNDPMAPTVDHIVPKSIQRIDELSNLRTAHRRCNELRGTAKDEHQLVLAA